VTSVVNDVFPPMLGTEPRTATAFTGGVADGSAAAAVAGTASVAKAASATQPC
jgi:hypothetical protein